jgi:hypothetical protein
MYWPYDEVTLKSGKTDSEVHVDSPWLQITVQLESEHSERAKALVQKFENGSIKPEDIHELNWFFKSLAAYPLCYVLPRNAWPEKLENYSIKDKSLLGKAPSQFLASALSNKEHERDIKAVSKDPLFSGEWKWDAGGAIQFSTSSRGIDPKALFSVARRFHLLSSVESNTTEALFETVKAMKTDKAKFERASALMVRQNHYVTERCNAALTPALGTALGAKKYVEEFIRAEYGHDRILKSAMKAMGKDAEAIPVTSHAKVLMDLLKFSGERNFLAFTMLVDFFERSSYQESDPLAKVLEHGGLTAAANQINRHMDINDSGEHENVALNFLSTMGPITKEYAEEALHIAEAATNIINSVSTGVRELLENS